MKTQLIIDGNYILQKCTYILKTNRQIKEGLSDLLISEFKKMSKSYYYDRIFFVSDSKGGSWRKLIFADYKGKRKKDESIDWEFVYKTYDTYKDYVKSRTNVKFLELRNIEGDDFIAHIVKTSNKEGYSNVIVASDIDINQLLIYDINKNYINIQWNYKFSDEKLYLPENYQLFLSESIKQDVDMFNISQDDFVGHLENIISKTTIKIINREESVFCKIVWGDPSDNISSIIKSKGGEIDEEGRGIGKDGAKTIYKVYKEIYPDPINFDSDDFLNKLIDVIIYVKKIKNVSKDPIKDKITLNKKLIILDDKYMPQHIKDNMINHYVEVLNTNITYEISNLEEELEKSGYFNQKVEDIPENFRIEQSEEIFNPDNFWDL